MLSPSWRPVRGPLILLEWFWLPRWSRWTQTRPHHSRYRSFSPLLFNFALSFLSLIESHYSVELSVSPGVSRLTPHSPAAGDVCSTDTFNLGVSRISASTTWAVLAVSYGIADRSVSNFQGHTQTSWCQNLQRKDLFLSLLACFNYKKCVFGSCTDIIIQ